MDNHIYSKTDDSEDDISEKRLSISSDYSSYSSHLQNRSSIDNIHNAANMEPNKK